MLQLFTKVKQQEILLTSLYPVPVEELESCNPLYQLTLCLRLQKVNPSEEKQLTDMVCDRSLSPALSFISSVGDY